MREAMQLRGHKEGEKSSFLSKFYIFSTVVYILNTILDIFNLEAGQFEEKIFRFKNINMLLCGLAYPLVDSDTFRLLFSIEQQGIFETSLRSSDAIKVLQQKLDKELNQINKLTYFVIVFIMGTLSIAPLMAAILKTYPKLLTGSWDTINVTKFSLPISFWYPQEYANIYTYILLYTLQIFYIYLFSGYMYCVLTSGFMALKITIYNLKYLCVTVEEGRNRLEEVNKNFGNGELSYEDRSHLERMLSLRVYLVNIIKLHDMICRSAGNLNRDLERMYTVFNNTICFQICVCLYSSVKMEDFVLKVEHILLVIPLAYILFLYCSNAQELLNEGENFRMTLWGSFFVDTPKWYKSSLLIMMIRTTKELEIKPFGFYVLNLKTFSVVMKAAYSYFNMLNSLKKRI